MCLGGLYLYLARLPHLVLMTHVCYSAGYEYDPGADGRITWAYKNQPTWQINAAAMPPNAGTQIGQRLISVEPMYMYVDAFCRFNRGPC